ncbi:diphthine--ammonia ligase [Candidatus Woesearchaeota archaeon]|nr:diphthine--ammonia ligase [Candidatus Woesearchaeota archaeon]
MKLGVLFSGGKDSSYAAYLASQNNELVCLITIHSKNLYSYMFHTPSISKTKLQAEVMNLPLIEVNTKGEKEIELNDLKDAIIDAKKKYKIEGIVTGAVESVYQASRIQKICDDLGLEVFNPLWQKNQIELLNDLIKNKFEVIIVAVAAEGFDTSWLGRKIDVNMIEELVKLNKKYGINPAFEGGEAESFVLNCPLFKKKLKVVNKRIIDDRIEVELE